MAAPPKWFQEWVKNDFHHLNWKVGRIEILQWIILTGILGGAIAVICKIL